MNQNQKQPSKLRLSYSLLNLWKRGKYDEAMKLYLHVEEREPTSAMLRGIAFDRKAKEIALKDHRLPDELGGSPLVGEITVSEKVIVPFGNWELSAEYDIHAGDDILELKCSDILDSGDYMSTLQVPFYLFVQNLTGRPAKRGLVYRFDPTLHTWDMSILYWNKRIEDEVDTEIAKLAPAIEELFKEEGVI